MTIMPAMNTQKIQTKTDTHLSKYICTNTHTQMQLRTWCYRSSSMNSKRFRPLMHQNTKSTGSKKCGQTAGAYHTHILSHRCERSGSRAHALTRSSLENPVNSSHYLFVASFSDLSFHPGPCSWSKCRHKLEGLELKLKEAKARVQRNRQFKSDQKRDSDHAPRPQSRVQTDCRAVGPDRVKSA
jgi:hypothetical protein